MADCIQPDSGIESFGLIKARDPDHHPTPYRLHEGQGAVITSPGISVAIYHNCACVSHSDLRTHHMLNAARRKWRSKI